MVALFRATAHAGGSWMVTLTRSCERTVPFSASRCAVQSPVQNQLCAPHSFYILLHEAAEPAYQVTVLHIRMHVVGTPQVCAVDGERCARQAAVHAEGHRNR